MTLHPSVLMTRLTIPQYEYDRFNFDFDQHIRRELLVKAQVSIWEAIGVDLSDDWRDLMPNAARPSFTLQFLGITDRIEPDKVSQFVAMRHVTLYILLLHNSWQNCKVGDFCVADAIKGVSYDDTMRFVRLLTPSQPLRSWSSWRDMNTVIETETWEFSPRKFFVKGAIIEMWERVK